ncbi:hypothetical protein [Flagellimonas aurea]|uniref:hypothetical protein n=1 Tax=Flagellimonas aurea TaxID=2915619 RepID=UPI0035CF4592
MLDDYFFMADAYGDENNETLKPFELPLVPRGTELGNFTGNYGLDIVLSEGDYKPLSSDTGFLMDLNFVRASETIIDLSALPTGYVEKQFKEAIGLFMDPAAFWGLHFSNGKVWVKESGSWTKKTGQQIYDTILSKFATKNNVYVNIVGHLGRTYDYYGAYSSRLGGTDIIKLGLTGTTTSETQFTTNGWPLLILNTEQDHTGDTNSVFLQLVHNPQSTVALYGEVANLTEVAENGFLSPNQLIPEQTVAQDGSTIDNPYTNAIEFVFPAVPATGSLKANVACWNRLLYQGIDLIVLEDVGGTVIEHPVKPLDTLFGPILMERRMTTTDDDNISYSFCTNTKLVDISKIDDEGLAILSSFQNKIVSNRIAYEFNGDISIQKTLIYELEKKSAISLTSFYQKGKTGSVSPIAANFPFVEHENNTYDLVEPYFLESIVFSDYDRTINGLVIKTKIKEYPNKFLLGLTEEEKDELTLIVNTGDFLNTSFYFLPILPEESPFQSPEGIEFYKFHLAILCETPLGDIHLIRPDSPIAIYSCDQCVYFTSDFGKYMNKGLTSVIDNVTIEKTI